MRAVPIFPVSFWGVSPSLNRSNGVNTAYSYELDSDLGQINHAWAPSAGQTAAVYGFQHDAAGRITGLSINRPDLEWAPGLNYAQTYGAPTNLNKLEATPVQAAPRSPRVPMFLVGA